jgi:hypothetical protein
MKTTNLFRFLVAIFFLTLLSSCAEVLEKPLTNDQLTVSAPVDNLVTADSLQTFHWEPLEGASSYQLQIVSPKFDSIVKFVADTSMSINFFPFALKTGQYQWRVRAKNQNTMTQFSAPRNLTIQ